MPEIHQSGPSAATGMPPAFDPALHGGDDIDYALGCECADPALQIERWGQEASATDPN
jgi:hypothetical protein